MKKSNKILVLLCFFISLISSTMYGWWSYWLTSETHKKMGDDSVVGALSSDEYPDLWKFTEKISKGCNTESHNTAIDKDDNNNALNGGFTIAWWNKSLNFYENKDYENA